MNFFLSRGPVSDVRSSASTLWGKSSGFSLSTTDGTWPKPTKTGVDGAPHLPFMDFSDTFPASHHGFNKTMPFKGTTAEVLNQGNIFILYHIIVTTLLPFCVHLINVPPTYFV